ncbi:hypothetical protein LX36DRAFT_664919 [Colletotrichum falcatum]|nr:hypothetical protein LX36DRAFT_664919 [Colletotrichum falcatum]
MPCRALPCTALRCATCMCAALHAPRRPPSCSFPARVQPGPDRGGRTNGGHNGVGAVKPTNDVDEEGVGTGRGMGRRFGPWHPQDPHCGFPHNGTSFNKGDYG